MKSPDIELRITQIQQEITEIQREIKRLYLMKVDKLQDIRNLEAKRDEISGLKTRVIDSEIRMGIPYKDGWF